MEKSSKKSKMVKNTQNNFKIQKNLKKFKILREAQENSKKHRKARKMKKRQRKAQKAQIQKSTLFIKKPLTRISQNSVNSNICKVNCNNFLSWNFVDVLLNFLYCIFIRLSWAIFKNFF